MTLYHGAHTRFTVHAGLCLTDDLTAATHYASNGEIAVVQLDLDGLTTADVADYDNDSNTAPGDDGESTADVLRYRDADEQGHTHSTVRLMSDVAVSHVKVVAVVSMAWWAAGEECDIAEDERVDWILGQRDAHDTSDDAIDAHWS